MSAATLEQRYRRLLSCYPAGHRAAYGEEMIGVLLASAPSGQRRPGLTETFDLFRGGLRVRLRALTTGSPDPGWRNALALTSLLSPLLLVSLLPHQNLGWIASLSWFSARPALALGGIGMLVLPAALGLAGARRAGAFAAVAVLIWFMVQAGIGGLLNDPRVAAYSVSLVIQAVALAAGPGPRQALRLVTRGGVLLALPWILTAAYTGGLIATSYAVPRPVDFAVILIVALAGLVALAKPGGRRVIMLTVAIPASAFAVTLLTSVNVQFYEMSFAAAMLALYLPPLMLGGLAYLAARRSAGSAGSPAVGATA